MGIKFSKAVRIRMAAAIAMVAVVTASNILVRYPFEVRLGGLDLANLLTWGAFSYPVAFLVTDLTNRHLGPATARKIVVIGFLVGIALSFGLASPRIAIASGTAFLVGQLLDIAVFSRFRARAWWLPPTLGPLAGSALDTLLFFSLAFAPWFGLLDTGFGLADGSLGMAAPLLGVGMTVPLWLSLAAGDFTVKFLAAGLLLAPYRVLMGALTADRAAVAAG